VLFTSFQFLAFLLVVLAAHQALPLHARRWWMLAASIYFYGSWSVPYLGLIGAQLLVDWSCGRLLSRTADPRARRAILAVSIVANLSALCVFKYAGLLVRSLAPLGLQLPVPELTLPLAISFYTFESMSYTIDVYRRQLEPVRSPLELALFITWFPHLVAGPIIRPRDLVPQLGELRPLGRQAFFGGLGLMLVGYAKKLLLADWLATYADPVFARPAYFNSLELLVALYAYAFQIYLDFSAYTDIARGASRWFGIELPENFRDPYRAASITDFWRRWHMTLSHWLRDYLYVPLGGNRGGRARTYANLMVTMLLGGLWHGASWTFVVWGGLHGLYLAVERALGIGAPATDAGRGRGGRLARALRMLLTFHLVCLAWIFFRAPTFAVAREYLAGLASATFHVPPERLLGLLGAVALMGIYLAAAPLRRLVVELDPGPSPARQLAVAVAAGIVVVVLTALGASSNAFIYFQF
jgi:alginate O-acetyltransferase complex protein AlgI